MPRASTRPVNENIKGELQDNFALLISSLTSPRDIQQFFETFLTSEEKTMLTKRLMLHLMLENRYTALEIAAVLGLSRDTVRIHKLVWISGGDVYKSIIAKLASKRKTSQFWKSVETILRPLEYALQAKSNMKARAKLLSGEYE
jgi:uncharacterized protein YerC